MCIRDRSCSLGDCSWLVQGTFFALLVDGVVAPFEINECRLLVANPSQESRLDEFRTGARFVWCEAEVSVERGATCSDRSSFC